jgi:hypothetical protein
MRIASAFQRALPCLLLLIGTLAPGPVRAAHIENVDFSDRARIGEHELPLRSLGLLRYRVLFKGYVGALYLPEAVPFERALEDVPKRLELHYFWNIAGRDFGPAAQQVLERQLGPAELAALRERIERLNAAYRDVAPGDRYALSYAPGEGTSLSLNGAPIVTIPGADFARAYFGIWLGRAPLDEAFRDQLLRPASDSGARAARLP